MGTYGARDRRAELGPQGAVRDAHSLTREAPGNCAASFAPVVRCFSLTIFQPVRGCYAIGREQARRLSHRQMVSGPALLEAPSTQRDEVIDNDRVARSFAFCADAKMERRVLVQNFNWLQDTGSAGSISYTIW